MYLLLAFEAQSQILPRWWTFWRWKVGVTAHAHNRTGICSVDNDLDSTLRLLKDLSAVHARSVHRKELTRKKDYKVSRGKFCYLNLELNANCSLAGKWVAFMLGGCPIRPARRRWNGFSEDLAEFVTSISRMVLGLWWVDDVIAD